MRLDLPDDEWTALKEVIESQVGRQIFVLLWVSC